MNFKTTFPTLNDAIIMEDVARSIAAGKPDFRSIAAYIVARSAEEMSDREVSDLLNKSLPEVMDLFAQALAECLKSRNVMKRNSVDNVALSDDEKQRLSALMEQMRGRQGDPQ